jgi:hypothetical protein
MVVRSRTNVKCLAGPDRCPEFSPSVWPNSLILTADEMGTMIDPSDKTISRTSGRPVVTGYTPDGRIILVVYEQLDDVTVYPVTAYELDD